MNYISFENLICDTSVYPSIFPNIDPAGLLVLPLCNKKLYRLSKKKGVLPYFIKTIICEKILKNINDNPSQLSSLLNRVFYLKMEPFVLLAEWQSKINYSHSKVFLNLALQKVADQHVDMFKNRDKLMIMDKQTNQGKNNELIRNSPEFPRLRRVEFNQESTLNNAFKIAQSLRDVGKDCSEIYSKIMDEIQEKPEVLKEPFYYLTGTELIGCLGVPLVEIYFLLKKYSLRASYLAICLEKLERQSDDYRRLLIRGDMLVNEDWIKSPNYNEEVYIYLAKIQLHLQNREGAMKCLNLAKKEIYKLSLNHAYFSSKLHEYLLKVIKIEKNNKFDYKKTLLKFKIHFKNLISDKKNDFLITLAEAYGIYYPKKIRKVIFLIDKNKLEYEKLLKVLSLEMNYSPDQTSALSYVLDQIDYNKVQATVQAIK
ncbi:MAG: hypothetical protein LW832_08920 [Parachlamydia sp.]|jgi:hypothetical protein|nr:hypothetical protein [Parachlamydia sp.]